MAVLNLATRRLWAGLCVLAGLAGCSPTSGNAERGDMGPRAGTVTAGGSSGSETAGTGAAGAAASSNAGSGGVSGGMTAGAGNGGAGAAAGGSAGSDGASAAAGVAAGGSSDGGAGDGGTTASGTTSGGGGMGGAPPELVMPIERGQNYVLEFGDILFEVNPEVGARIVTFSFQGQNVLTGPNVNPDNYGSTFTLSPQEGQDSAPGSGWPPPPALDAQAYQVVIEEQTIVMTSSDAEVASGTVRVIKRFTPDLAFGGVHVEYELENTGTTDVTWAPWEITRVLPGGLTFFPTGEQEGPRLELTVQKEGGWTWYQHDYMAINGDYGDKYVADGSGGWLAQANGRVLFLKTFPDVAVNQLAPNEGDVEIYSNNVENLAQAYVEIEPQGPYTMIAPGVSLSWTVSWYLKELPDNAEIAVGNPELVAFVEAQLP